MPSVFLRSFANFFVLAFLADSLMTVLGVVVGMVFGAGLESGETLPVLHEVQSALALFVAILAMAAIPSMAATPRLAPSVFVPLTAFSLWTVTGALPFSLSLDIDHAALIRALAAAQVGISVAVMFRIRELCGQWLFTEEWFAQPLFSVRYALAYSVIASVLIVGATVAMTITSLFLGLETITGGFVRFDSQGAVLADRRYVLESDPKANERDPVKWREIRLVGMTHIGEEAAYRALFGDLGRASALTIVLSEGISDTEGHLEEGLSYEGLAEFLGVTQQRNLADYIESPDTNQDAAAFGPGATFVDADVDVDDFAPETIAWLGQVSTIYSGSSAFETFREIYAEMLASPELVQTINNDILNRRNSNLISWIRASRINYREIVVPWGALHLPTIEKEIENMGFELQANTYVPVISWGTIRDALFDSDDV